MTARTQTPRNTTWSRDKFPTLGVDEDRPNARLART
uniref:Uncharacterized protein n=1 Tax=Anguilla anguilla TaxID=7936 RepID=A0A0E9QMJ9_ANGAN